jgi:hypothetical protein
MSEADTMKTINVVFWVVVAGIVFSLGAGVYTGVKHGGKKAEPVQTTVPLPAS